LRGQGTIFAFDEKGYLKRMPSEETMGLIIERAKQKLTGGNVGPTSHTCAMTTPKKNDQLLFGLP
jgi:hypothetical protein